MKLQWSAIGVEVAKREEDTLLEMKINMWINIRGFLLHTSNKKITAKNQSSSYQVEWGQEERKEKRVRVDKKTFLYIPHHFIISIINK